MGSSPRAELKSVFPRVNGVRGLRSISPRAWIQGKMMKAPVVETTAGNLGRLRAGYDVGGRARRSNVGRRVGRS
jgi:hypothetical protein